MELTLVTNIFTDKSTESTLLVDGEFQCYTLELPVKDGLPGSAIPSGVYDVKLLPSLKFKASTDPWVLGYADSIPHILGIPNRSNILIHWGNFDTDTEGCILTGQKETKDEVELSRAAFAALHKKLIGAESVKLTVTGRNP
jgi:hypothetical protein